MADEPDQQASTSAWEMVTQEYVATAFQTDRLKVPGGWIYRSRGIYDAKQTGIAMCFVPQLGHHSDD